MIRNLKVKTRMLIILGAIIIIGITLLFLNYIPFYAPSYFIWGGIFLGVISFLGIVFPFRIMGKKPRKYSTIVFSICVILIIGSFIWPPTITQSRMPHQRLDDFLPEFQVSEYHEALADVSAEKLQNAVLSVSLSDIPVVNLLLRLRFMFSDKPYVQNETPFLDLNSDSGFLILDDSDPSERVYGMVGKPWAEDVSMGVNTARQFNAFNAPGNIKIAFNFKIEDRGDQGTLISTETRNLGNDRAAQRIFARYWRVIYPGSSIIRRVWLNAIINKAKSM